MAEYVSDLFEAGSLLHHAAGHGVPEDVGAGERRVDPARRRARATTLETAVLEIGMPQCIPKCFTNTRRSSVAGRSPRR